MDKLWTVLRASAIVLLSVNVAIAQQNQMTFFATSVGSGMGASLGGLNGADKHCQTLAAAARGRTHVACVSQHAGAGAVNARDRIGKGPWSNVKGVVIAQNVDELHSARPT